MISHEQIGNEIVISYFNEKGGISLERIQIPRSEMYEWEECSDTETGASKQYKSHLGRSVKKIPKRYLGRYRQFEFLNSLSEERKNRIFSMNEPKKWFMDIETQVIDGLPDAKLAREKVLSNAFCDQDGNVFIQGTKRLTAVEKETLENRINAYFKDPKNYSNGKKPIDKNFVVKYKHYETESMMLADLFYTFIPKMPLITGWNFVKFDWQFLVNRAKNLNIRPEKASPTGNSMTLVLKDKYDKTKKDKVEMPMHRAVVDYLTIYEKWDSSIKLKSSSSLDAVADVVLGIKKIHYEGTLQGLYEADYEKFIFYNAVDTILVALIDERLQTFNTMMTLANEGHVDLHDAAFASVIMESLFSEEYSKDDVVLIKQDYPDDDTSYSGGYVEEPGKGIRNKVIIWDFQSMFPSIMMFCNTGIDTYLGKTLDGGKTYIDIHGDVHPVEKDKHIWMTSGVVYDKTKPSIMRKVLSRLFDTRIFAKHATGIIDLEIKELEKMMANAS